MIPPNNLKKMKGIDKGQGGVQEVHSHLPKKEDGRISKLKEKLRDI